LPGCQSSRVRCSLAAPALLIVLAVCATAASPASAASPGTRVTNAGAGAHDTMPTWVSGSRLAFQRRIPGGPMFSCNVGMLHTIDIDGSGDQTGPAFYPPPYRYSSASGRVAFIPNSANCTGPFPTAYEVTTSALDGSDPFVVAAPPLSNNIQQIFAVSPDGTKLAFANQDTPGQDPWLYVVGADGTGLTRIGLSPGWAAFSPDGTKIAFSSGGGIQVGNTDGSATRQIAQHQDGQVAWSPDGSVIAVAGAGLVFLDPDATDESCPHGGCTPPTGDPPRTITTEYVSDPAWSPDGAFLAVKRSVYVPGGQDTEEMAIVSAAGTGFHDVTSTGGFVTSGPAWSPDGTKLAFASYQDSVLKPVDSGFESLGLTSLYVVDLSGELISDTDGDGIPDPLDSDPNTPSGSFSDGAGTAGTIVDRAGLTVEVADEPAPDGVRVTVGAGTGRVTLSVCGFTVRLSAGSEAILTCGSVKVRVLQGDAQVVLGGGLTVVSVPAGVTAKVSENADGSFKVENLGGGSLTVTVDGIVTPVAAGQTKTVTALDFVGFNAPVDNPAVLNVVKAGQSVPFKWRLMRADGSPYTSLGSVSMTVTSLSCNLGGTADMLEEVAAGSSGLQNLGNGNYQINWKAPKEYAGSCKMLHLNLGEGVTRDAYFQFVK
jgi:WD40 repeat protein